MARYAIEEYARWEDIDAAGIINYQAYLRFFGLAEAELLRSAGLNYRFLFEVLGIWLPRVRVECNFHEPVKLDELLVVEAYFSRIGHTSIHLDFEVRRKADPSRSVASGRYVLVCVRQGDFQPVRVPLELREKISRFVEPPEVAHGVPESVRRSRRPAPLREEGFQEVADHPAALPGRQRQVGRLTARGLRSESDPFAGPFADLEQVLGLNRPGAYW